MDKNVCMCFNSTALFGQTVTSLNAITLDFIFQGIMIDLNHAYHYINYII